MTLISPPLRPNSDIEKRNITHSTGTSAFALIDDTPDDDTTYVRVAAGAQFPNGWARLGLTDMGALAANQRIKQVRIRGRVRMHSAVAGDAAIIHARLWDPQSGLGYPPAGWEPEPVGIGDQFVTGQTTFVAKTGAWWTKPPPKDTGGEWTKKIVDRLNLHLAWYYGDFGTENLRLSEAYVDVDVRDQPVVSGVTVTGEDASSRPQVAWTYTPNADSDPQVAAHVKVFSSAQYSAVGFDPELSSATWDSGVRAGFGGVQIQIAMDLVNGVTYRAYVKGAQDFNGAYWFSDWAFDTFTMALTPPPTPTLTVTPDPAMPGLRNLLAFAAQVNALSADDAGFETTIGNWIAGVGATPVRSTAQAGHGVASMLYTSNGTASPFFTNSGGTGGPGAVITKAGQQFRLSGRFRAGTTGRAWRIVARQHDAANNFVNQTNGATGTDTTSWTSMPEVTHTATVDGRLYFQFETATTPVNGEQHFFDQLMIVPGASSPTWHPGGFLPAASPAIEYAWVTDRPGNLASRQLATGGDATRTAAGFFTTGASSRVDYDPTQRHAGAGSIRWDVEDTTSKLYFGWPSSTDNNATPAYVLAAVPGRTYTFSVWARTLSSNFNSQLNLQAIDKDGTAVGSPTSSGAITVLSSGWARFQATITVPAGACYVRPHLDNTSSVTGRDVFVDAAQWELGAAATALSVTSGGEPVVWKPVRGLVIGQSNLADAPGQSFAVWDHEVPPGRTVLYRAYVHAFDETSGQETSSLTTAHVATMLDPPGRGNWLLSQVAVAPIYRGPVQTLQLTESKHEEQTVYYPIRPQPDQRAVVLSDHLGGWDGTLSLAARTLEEWLLVDELLGLPACLWLVEPDFGARYIRLGDRAQARVRWRQGCAVDPLTGAVLPQGLWERALTLPFVETGRPASDEQAILPATAAV